VVRITPVVNGRIRSKHDLELGIRGWGLGVGITTPYPLSPSPCRCPVGIERDRLLFRRRAGDDAVMNGASPSVLEVAGHLRLRAPVVAQAVVAALFGRVGEGGYEFERAAPAIERRDERLDDRDRAVVGARIAPSFEVVRFGHVPQTPFGSFVEMQTQMRG